MNLLIPLILTIIIEFLVYLVFIRKKVLSLLLFSTLINAFTNPLANLAYISGVNVLLIELAVFIVEIPLIKYLFKIGWKKAMLISFIANLVSFLLGLVIFQLI